MRLAHIHASVSPGLGLVGLGFPMATSDGEAGAQAPVAARDVRGRERFVSLVAAPIGDAAVPSSTSYEGRSNDRAAPASPVSGDSPARSGKSAAGKLSNFSSGICSRYLDANGYFTLRHRRGMIFGTVFKRNQRGAQR